MASISDKAEEVVGAAKQTAGDLTGNSELHAEGTVDKARAQVKQGVDAAADAVTDTVQQASGELSQVADKAADATKQLHLGDKRVLIVAAIAGITFTLLVRRNRSR